MKSANPPRKTTSNHFHPYVSDRDFLSPVGNVSEEALKRGKETHREALLAEVETLAEKIPHWFKMKTALSPKWASSIGDGVLIAPAGRDFNMLDESIRRLATVVREQPPGELMTCLRSVDRAFRHLKLRQKIAAMTTRAMQKIPRRPLDWFIRTQTADGVFGKSAARFLELSLQVRRGVIEAGSVTWSEFDELFLRYRNDQFWEKGKGPKTVLESRAGSLSAGPAAVAYTVYLEIELEDRNWVLRHFQTIGPLKIFLERNLQDVELLKRIETHFALMLPLAEHLEEKKATLRRKATERKRISRRKSVRKRDTGDAAPL